MGQAIQTLCPGTRDVPLFLHKKAGQWEPHSAVPASPSLPLPLTENRRDRGRAMYGAEGTDLGDGSGSREEAPRVARSFLPSQRSQTVPTQGPVSEGVSEDTGHREGCQGGNSTALSFFTSHHLWPTHPSTAEAGQAFSGALKEIQSQQGQMRPLRAHEGWRQRCTLDCRVFPSDPDAATGASGAPKTTSSSERGAKTKTRQDSCHFRRLEGCRSHATH